jgi:aryl-alcohol dehydrogenase-like predicted oxidoreductase
MPTMEYRKLGKSALQVSRIAFGAMSLKGDTNSNKNVISRALDLGINYFDTADLYEKGENEKFIGAILKEKRKDVIIATKVGNQWRPDGSGWDWNPRKEYILACIEESLQRLNTDYIDLYQLHGGTIQDPIDETIEAFELLVQQGKIRYYGISSIRPNVIREYVKRSNIVSVMMQYSLLDRRPEESCLPLLQQHGISVVTRGSVAQGLLIDKPPKEYLNHSSDQVGKAAQAIQNLSGAKRSAGQTTLQFVLQHPAIISAVVGIRTLEQLEEAVATIDTPQLAKEELEFLQQSIPANYYEDHR